MIKYLDNDALWDSSFEGFIPVWEIPSGKLEIIMDYFQYSKILNLILA